MSIPARYPNNALPNLAMERERNWTVWRALAIAAGTWCVILLGIVGWLVWRG